ncbi:MAG: hypothetical protein Phog2KO_48370 [Phototrophicaceae bacterium]
MIISCIILYIIVYHHLPFNHYRKCYVVESVEIYIPNERPMRLGVDDTIEGGDILPEFELAVKDIFT